MCQAPRISLQTHRIARASDHRSINHTQVERLQTKARLLRQCGEREAVSEARLVLRQLLDTDEGQVVCVCVCVCARARARDIKPDFNKSNRGV